MSETISELDMSGSIFRENTKIELKKINFIYGENGSGKTSISRSIAKHHVTDDTNIYVYNTDFVNSNFEDEEIKGIFKLGEGDIDKTKKIDELTKEKQKNIESKEKIEKSINEKNETKRKNEENIKESFWNITKGDRNNLKEVFKGLNKKQQLIESIIKRFDEGNHENKSTNSNFSLDRYNDLFKDERFKYNTFSYETDTLNNLFEELNKILVQSIVDSNDSYISKQIRKLGNLSWVHEGAKYMENDTCPFCSQDLSSELSNQLKDLFDHSYSENLKNLDAISERLTTESNKLSLLKTEIEKKFDDSPLESQINELIIAINNGLNSTREKKINMSKQLEQVEFTEVIRNLKQAVDSYNNQINGYNKETDELDDTREKFIDNYFSNLISNNEKILKNYIKDIKGNDKAIEGLNKQKNEKDTKIRELETQITELTKTTSNIIEVADKLNNMLKTYNFNSFKIKIENNNYKITRNNGDSAFNTLSEGEKNFITFLYFCYMCEGGTTEDDLTKSKIIVIDDPMSSLDSNAMNVICKLTREFIYKCHKQQDDVLQIVVLTHNYFFYNEIKDNKYTKIRTPEGKYVHHYSDNNNNNNNNNVLYGAISKNDQDSEFNVISKSTINNTYDLLWKDALSNSNSISKLNSMRRILEHYFTFTGSVKNIKNIVDCMESNINAADVELFYWLIDSINSGSHTISNDFDYSLNNNKYSRVDTVFKDIFDKTQNIGHYTMMTEKIQK